MDFPGKGLTLSLLSLFFVQAAAAQPTSREEGQEAPIVVLAALDKITTQLSTIEIRLDQTVRFGTLDITLRTCRKNPPEETPETVAFLEINDVGHDNQNRQIFSGWMFASSPALSPLEHSVYDIWVKDCKISSGPASMAKE